MVLQAIVKNVSHNRARLLAKAVTNAGAALGLRQAEIARAIGVSEGQVSKLKTDAAGVTGKSDELSLYLIRVFRSLDAITGGDSASTKAWMRSPNADLGGIPAALIVTAAGLVEVMNYLDAARAPL